MPRNMAISPRASLTAIIFAIVFPTIVTLAYFVLLADQPASIQQGAYGIGKVIQFGFPAVWVFLILREPVSVSRPTRRGLGIGGLAEPLYVIRLDVDAREVVVGSKEKLATRNVPIKEVNWLGEIPFEELGEIQMDVRVRSTRPPKAAILRPLSATTAEVELIAPEDGIAPGQACVFYEDENDDTRVFGGGWITSTDQGSSSAIEATKALKQNSVEDFLITQ